MSLNESGHFFCRQDYKCHSFSSQLMILLSLPEVLFGPSKMIIKLHHESKKMYHSKVGDSKL